MKKTMIIKALLSILLVFSLCFPSSAIVNSKDELALALEDGSSAD